MKLRIAVIRKKVILLASIGFISCLLFVFIFPEAMINPSKGTIVIDPGHGGIDGGTNTDGLLEKDVNLAVAKYLKAIFEQKGYSIIMTRESDISLDDLNNASTSRHRRDLSARVDIINNSSAQLFISIHVNCSAIKPAADGSIVLYNDKSPQNRKLAYCIQRSLNDMVVNKKSRTVHDPQKGKLFVLGNAGIPGVLIETAFISNPDEKKLLAEDSFRKQLANAIAYGTEQYFKGLENPPISS